MVELENFERKTFKVKAIQITEENISEVAEMVGSYAQTVRSRYGDRLHIQVTTGHVNDRNQKTPAFIGDWVTFTGRNLDDYRVYKNRKFWAAFKRCSTDLRAEIYKVMENALSVDLEVSQISWGDLTENYTNQVMKLIEGE